METEDVRVGPAEHQSVREDEDKGASEKRMEGDESRKAGRPTSRIPTFQSSLARKRTTTPTAESSLQAKAEGLTREGQMKEKGVSAGEGLKTKLPVFGDREIALPVLSTQTPSSSTDDLSFANYLDPGSEASHAASLPINQSHSPDPKANTARSSEEPEDVLKRPVLRAETESYVVDSLSEPSPEPQSVSIDSLCKDEESDSSFQDDITDLQETCSPHCVEYADDPDKQCHDEDSVLLKKTEKCLSEVPFEASHKQRSSDVPPMSKKVDPSQTEQRKRTASGSRGKSFALFCVFPSVLLLLGGFGQHIWLYGVPKSVSHLMEQLELHWLEGFWLSQEKCSTDCRFTLVESLPEGLLFPHGSPHLQSISHTWTNLVNKANSSVNIAAFYLTLRDSDIGLSEPSAVQGKELFNQLKQLESRGVNLKIAVNAPQTSTADTDELAETGAEIREVDLQSVTGGIVHTKLWVVDRKHMYIGSANMDWRSLTQVKEVGISMEDCHCLAQDASRIFGVYWELGAQKSFSLPTYWPGRFSALSSSKYPLAVKFNGVPARVYLSSAPPQLSAYGRSDDLSSILSIIADAKEFIHVSVMDYLPMSEFTQPIRFWPAIDSALREAACARGVEVKLLVSCWSHSPGAMFVFLQSLAVLNKTPLRCNIHVKVFEVPSTPEQHLIPFARVNHAKYMVTDRVVYIGTSNWSENYFSQTAGVGLVVNQTDSVVEKGQQTVQYQLQKIFQRDWNSDFSQTLTDDHAEYCSNKKKL